MKRSYEVRSGLLACDDGEPTDARLEQSDVSFTTVVPATTQRAAMEGRRVPIPVRISADSQQSVDHKLEDFVPTEGSEPPSFQKLKSSVPRKTKTRNSQRRRRKSRRGGLKPLSEAMPSLASRFKKRRDNWLMAESPQISAMNYATPDLNELEIESLSTPYTVILRDSVIKSTWKRKAILTVERSAQSTSLLTDAKSESTYQSMSYTQSVMSAIDESELMDEDTDNEEYLHSSQSVPDRLKLSRLFTRLNQSLEEYDSGEEEDDEGDEDLDQSDTECQVLLCEGCCCPVLRWTVELLLCRPISR